MTDSDTASITVYTLFYLAITLCFVFETNEFVSAGLTIENIFGAVLRSEYDDFIMYHIRRTSLTLFQHSILPLGYFIGLSAISGFDFDSFPTGEIWWQTIINFSFLYPIITIIIVYYWSLKNWSNHPIAKRLALFCANSPSWRTVADTLNAEFRSPEKIVLRTSTISRIVATDNWLIKCSVYSLSLAHQSDSVLILCSADTHQISTEGPGAIQYVNIEVKTTRPNIKNFFIRCKALDFQLLQEKVRRPITILEGVKFHKTTVDHFLEVFREAVEHNPVYVPLPEMQIEPCIGCMVAESSVKLVKQCQGEESRCTNCYCRPMWCVNCMGRWFALRQEQDKPETWLSSICTCPLCRSTFCIFDVCPLETNIQLNQ